MFLVVLTLVIIIGSFPATWLLMLFLGNLGLHMSFWGTLPAGIIVTFFVAGSGSLNRYGRYQ
jgi:hypothetical protein